eukprot:SAG22_NODE_16561_length_322_cov_1.614350_1_plen_70_part_01
MGPAALHDPSGCVLRYTNIFEIGGKVADSPPPPSNRAAPAHTGAVTGGNDTAAAVAYYFSRGGTQGGEGI